MLCFRRLWMNLTLYEYKVDRQTHSRKNFVQLDVLSVKDDFYVLPYLRSKICMRCSILEGQLFMWSPIQEGGSYGVFYLRRGKLCAFYITILILSITLKWGINERTHSNKHDLNQLLFLIRLKNKCLHVFKMSNFCI